MDHVSCYTKKGEDGRKRPVNLDACAPIIQYLLFAWNRAAVWDRTLSGADIFNENIDILKRK